MDTIYGGYPEFAHKRLSTCACRLVLVTSGPPRTSRRQHHAEGGTLESCWKNRGAVDLLWVGRDTPSTAELSPAWPVEL